MENNIISDWLAKHGNPEIEQQVEREIEHMDIVHNLKKVISEYCEKYELTFVRYYEKGFIAYSINIKRKRNKRTYRHFLCYKDLDIVDNGVLK
jgi:PhoPQ-activated pathogenicity-related protein